MQKVDDRPRARANCSFYPACYVAGDCEHDGWKTGACGLSDEEKAIERRSFHDSLARTAMRHRLIERARRGDFDHLEEQAMKEAEHG